MKSSKELEAAFRESSIDHAEVSRSIIRNALLRDNEADWACYHWMEEYFYFAGDHMPNSKEIHLDSIDYKVLHGIYEIEVKDALGYKAWKNIWDKLFSHVKIRVWKNVTGKCDTCAYLTALRSKFSNGTLKLTVTRLHELHRATYMGEKLEYYNRRQEAKRNYREVMSVITDGMAQSHTQLPHFANITSSQDFLTLKISGVLDHGRDKFNMFVCCPSVTSTANLSIHSFHLNLEDWIDEMKRQPKKIYWQIDGASDNSAKHVLAYCEYLVSSTQIEEIVISRLPVGKYLLH